jgi:hypothetical protein
VDLPCLHISAHGQGGHVSDVRNLRELPEIACMHVRMHGVDPLRAARPFTGVAERVLREYMMHGEHACGCTFRMLL